MTEAEHESSFALTKRRPISRPYGRAMGCLFEYFGENWLRYNGTALYSIFKHFITRRWPRPGIPSLWEAETRLSYISIPWPVHQQLWYWPKCISSGIYQSQQQQGHIPKLLVYSMSTFLRRGRYAYDVYHVQTTVKNIADVKHLRNCAPTSKRSAKKQVNKCGRTCVRQLLPITRMTIISWAKWHREHKRKL